MPAQQDQLAAALLGLGGGMRTFAPAVALVLVGGRPLSERARRALLIAAVGELIADKLPSTPSRWSPAGLSARIGVSGAAGHQLAGAPGIAISASSAILAAFVGSRLRTAVHGPATRFLAAAAEDALSYTVAIAAAKRAVPARSTG